MLHFPFFKQQNESFEQRLINLIDYCSTHYQSAGNKTLLEVGCGNGANCNYIASKSPSLEVIGIDLNEENLVIARENQTTQNIRFIQDDAQILKEIESNSVDILICIESALHYPDKHAFFSQIKRVLKPDGSFVVADILRRNKDSGRSLWWWKKSMKLHHANEEDYLIYASGNQLEYTSSVDITREIVMGYEGYRSWIPRESRSFSSFVLLRLTLSILVRLYLKELRRHKKYMVFSGVHA
jgi:ubiquinone/menaquinone biosynthesis C-methylase UbiE